MAPLAQISLSFFIKCLPREFCHGGRIQTSWCLSLDSVGVGNLASPHKVPDCRHHRDSDPVSSWVQGKTFQPQQKEPTHTPVVRNVYGLWGEFFRWKDPKTQMWLQWGNASLFTPPQCLSFSPTPRATWSWKYLLPQPVESCPDCGV